MAGKKLANIYVVEDTPMERTMLIDHLSKYSNVAVRGFFSGEGCIKEIIDNAAVVPDLVLVDYYLDSSMVSKKDGLDTLEKIKDISPETEVVMLTSVENTRIIDLAKKKGALDYVVKGPQSFAKIDSLIADHFTL